MAELGRMTKRYPSDLTNKGWARVEPLLPKPSRRGRKVAADLGSPALLAAAVIVYARAMYG